MPTSTVNGKVVSRDAGVAVIGLGAAGIAAVIGLRNAGLTNITVFEATGHAGGTWVYSGNVKSARSSMYKSLRCNIPKESMCYVGRPFNKEANSFASHRDVASYLQGIADEENILPLVRFNSPVAKVVPVEPNDFKTAWAIQTWKHPKASSAAANENNQSNSNVSSSKVSGNLSVSDENELTSQLSDVEYFDAVVVCNGHFTGMLAMPSVACQFVASAKQRAFVSSITDALAPCLFYLPFGPGSAHVMCCSTQTSFADGIALDSCSSPPTPLVLTVTLNCASVPVVPNLTY